MILDGPPFVFVRYLSHAQKLQKMYFANYNTTTTLQLYSWS